MTKLNKAQKARFEEMQEMVPSLDGVTEAISAIDTDSATLDKFIANVASALGAVADLESLLRELEDDADKLKEELTGEA